MRRYLLVVLVLGYLPCLTGCWVERVTASQYKPGIEIAETPKECYEGPEQLTPREKALGKYAAILKKSILAYNTWAHEQNVKNGYVSKDFPQTTQERLNHEDKKIQENTVKAEIVPLEKETK